MLIGNTLKEVVKKANPKFDIVTELFGENIVITKNSPYYKILKNQPVLTCWYSPAKNISDITPRIFVCFMPIPTKKRWACEDLHRTLEKKV